MNKRIALRTFLALCLTSTGPLHAFGIGWRQKEGSGGFPGEYLSSLTASARAAGMGNAFSVVGGKVSSIYGNPAGLSEITAQELSFLNSELFYGDRCNYLGYGYPFSERHALGIGYLTLNSAEAQKTTILGEENGKFRDSQRAYFLSYAQKLHIPLSVGANFKIVTQNLAGYSARGYGLDLGMIIPLANGLRLGICLQNLVPPKLRLIEQTDTFPANLRAGIGYQCFRNKLIFAVDASVLNIYRPRDCIFHWWTGVEYRFLKIFALRAGVNYKTITAGLGISTRKFIFDYAASFHNLGVIHHFSLRFRFGLLPAVEEQELARKKEAFNKEKQEWEQKKLAVEKLCAIAEKINQRDYETAKILAERLLTAEPENPEAKKLLAIAKQEAEKTVLERTLNLALKHFKEEKYEQANKEFIRVLDLNPAQPVAAELKHLTQAYVYIKQEKYVEANKEIIATLKINPDNQKAKNLQRRLQTVLGIVGSEGNK